MQSLVYDHMEVVMARLLALLAIVAACCAAPPKIVRPCSVQDYDCIRRNLAANSRCNAQVAGAMPAQYTITRFVFDTPYFNATYVDNGLTIKNHDKCAVSEFFYNLATDNAVLAVRCPGLVFSSNRTLMQHYAQGEDTFYSYEYEGIYPEVILTVNLMPANAMSLCTTNAFAYVSALPEFTISPNDQQTKDFLSPDLSFLNIYERETFYFRANELLRYFVNSRLCHFGCDF